LRSAQDEETILLVITMAKNAVKRIRMVSQDS